MTRRYDNALRTEQAERTRERILEAFADQLADARDDFSIPKIAERAGVSVRTVYHHFPNREAQIDAVAKWLDARMTGEDPGPASIDEVLPFQHRMFRTFFENESIMRAQLAPGVATQVRARRRRKREEQLERVVSPLMMPEEARIAAALLKAIISADLGVALLDRHGLSKEHATRACAWLVRIVVEAIKRGDAPR